MFEKYILNTIYYLLLSITLVYSNYLYFYKHRNTLNLNFYFIGICCLEFLLNTPFKNKEIILFVSIFLLILFYWYFVYSILNSRKLMHIQNMIAIALISYLICREALFSDNKMFIIYSLFLIVSCLIYFIDLLFYTTRYELSKKLEFWFIIGNFFWAIFFIYRIGVMNYFKITDMLFLQLISKFFTIVNIITYLIFIKGLSCSQLKR